MTDKRLKLTKKELIEGIDNNFELYFRELNKRQDAEKKAERYLHFAIGGVICSLWLGYLIGIYMSSN